MSAGRERGSDRYVTAARQATPEQRAAAARLVHRMASDGDDERHLLEVLGLHEQDGA
ncbi:hypothetical protein OH540_21135 [Streptomyces sp. BPPL-273]|uniref:hypothetical protein n=1 Tax=Streptomyces sp. BPPL-273 TaxID=2987533 RepID=UPI0024AEDFF9|nr:hypothetical protein [Streptomyces sp. BPPL-273]WHM32410.1 hypothetical protein OH540_21135 [Streptomyces sp. BPPL-273]